MFVHVVIGPAGAGKTTYVLQRFLNGDLEQVPGYPVKVTRCGEIYALGDYTVARREKGTDTLPFNALPKILRTLDEMAEHGIKTVVAEGDRINNTTFFDHLIARRYAFELILVLRPMEECIRRLRAAGSTITATFWKTTFTKSRRNFLRYKDKAVRAAVVT